MIHPTSQSLGSHRAGALPATNGHAANHNKVESSRPDSLSTSHAEALQRALETTPEIRPEMVELGRKLASDPNYPPLEIIEQLSKLIINSADLSESA